MKIVVVGGGAAGFFAAIHAAGPGNEVIILEKSAKLLAKVKVSGGGRCNVTNGHEDVSSLHSFYPRGNRELRGPFSRFSNKDTMEWFTSRGVQLKTEPDGRVFPVSDDSQTIIDCLVREAAAVNVVVKTQTAVSAVTPIHGRFMIQLNPGEPVVADKIIIATGGNPHSHSYNWLSLLGHTVIPPVPSLFTFNIPGSPFISLMGVSVDPVTICLPGIRIMQSGPLLFTHWGLSGPAVLKLSAWAAREIANRNYELQVEINFLLSLNSETCASELRDFVPANAVRTVQVSPYGNLPARLWIRLCELAGIGTDKKWGDLSKAAIVNLCAWLTNCRLEMKGKTTFREEFVTCGGVSLKDVNMKTMESKRVPGLFFAGEVLDIDGVTGGFNFQAAWTTGYIAGKSASGFL